MIDADCDVTLTIREALQWAKATLSDRGFASARLESEILLLKAANLSRLDLYLKDSCPINAQAWCQYKKFIFRRLQHEPVAYICGEREFMGFLFHVNQHVLIPRPDTEILVEHAEEFLLNRQEGMRKALDLGTGSGCIAISLAKRVKGCQAKGWDISCDALEIAKLNQTHLGMASQFLEFFRQDILDPISWMECEERFDLIVSNPPYISYAESSCLPKDVKDWEPSGALFADSDGLAFYSMMAEYGKRLLQTDGQMMVEIGYRQAEAVKTLFSRYGWAKVQIKQDLNKNDRVVIAIP